MNIKLLTAVLAMTSLAACSNMSPDNASPPERRAAGGNLTTPAHSTGTTGSATGNRGSINSTTSGASLSLRPDAP